MEVHVSLTDRRRLSEQIYRQLRAGIRAGRLPATEALPSSRELADRLDVSRNTVVAAYERLAAEGLVRSRPGSGVFVTEPAIAPATPYRTEPDSYPQPQPVWDTLGSSHYDATAAPEIDMRAGIPSREHFPYAAWRARISRQLRPSVLGTSAYGEPAGSPALREAIAAHIAVSRGVRAEPEEVFVTSGTQQAIDLAARVLLAPGDLVAVEDPCYRPPAMLFRSLHLRVAGVPVDDEGLVVDAIPAGVRLVYVTPSHQFPLGMSLSTRRRRQLLDWADRTGAVIVEDDYDTEFRYGGRPLEPLQSLDRSWRVLYVGSFSKTLLPTLRLGFLLAPPSLRPALRTAKLVTDWHTSGPMQAALAEFISSGAFARHIRRMRRTYEARHQLVVSIVDSEFADCLVRIPSAAGIHVTGLLRPEVGRTDDEIVRLALRRGVDVSLPVSALAVTGPPRHGLVIGYGAVPTDRIPEGLRRLRECVS